MPPPPSPAKALNAILPLIAAGQAYEAHQKARTFAARYVKASQYDVAIDVLHQAAREMFKGGHLGSGTDLGVLMLDVYETRGETIDEESRGEFRSIILTTDEHSPLKTSTHNATYFTCRTRRTMEENPRRQSPCASIGPINSWLDTELIGHAPHRWSSKNGPNRNGDPLIHAYVGELLYKEHDFTAAEPYLLSSGSRDSGRLLASMFFEWSRSGAEPGAYASRGTIPFLRVGNVLGARSFLNHFLSLLVSSHPEVLAEPAPITMTVTPSGSDEVVPTTDHVLNFLQLAVRVCQRGAIGLSQSKRVQDIWVGLCGSYQSRRGVLAQPYYREVRPTIVSVPDPSVKLPQALSEIGQLFFDLPPPRAANANPMADIMAAMMGGAPSTLKRSGLPPPTPSITLD